MEPTRKKEGPVPLSGVNGGAKKQAKGWEGTQKVMHYRPNTDAVMTGLEETPFFSFIFVFLSFFLFFQLRGRKLYITSWKEETDGGMGGIQWSLVVGS